MKMTMSGSGWWRWMVLVAVVLSAAGTVTAGDSGQGLTEEAQECFECHEDESLEKNLTNGETLSLNVDGDLFLGSAHGAVDCTSCHRNVVLDDHPDERAVESREAHRAETIRATASPATAGPSGPPSATAFPWLSPWT